MHPKLEEVLKGIQPVLNMGTGLNFHWMPELSPTSILLAPRGTARKSLRKKLKGTVLDLESTMKSVVQAQMQLDLVRAALFRHSADFSNALSSIHELPAEVLRDILVLAVVGNGYESVQTRNSINLVCQKWRNLSIDSPQM